MRFGVPDELASDDGPQFRAKEFEDFLRRWGVNHRQSQGGDRRKDGQEDVDGQHKSRWQPRLGQDPASNVAVQEHPSQDLDPCQPCCCLEEG